MRATTISVALLRWRSSRLPAAYEEYASVALRRAASHCSLLVAAVVFVATLGVGVVSAQTPARHVVVISLDGLRPEFYLDAASPVPALRALVKAGSVARAAEAVFPSVTYPGHATIATGVRPARHGVGFNVMFDPKGGRSRWYEEAADLKAPPLWDWARAAGLTTAAVSWPSTLGARVDWLLPERDYHARPDPLPLLLAASTPGMFDRLGITPRPDMFKDVTEWDAFLAKTAGALIRRERPRLLLLHLVQLDVVQHRGGRDSEALPAALARIDGHVASLRQALADAGLTDRAVVVVTGDHGFADARATVYPNEVLARAGLGGCAWDGPGWRATAHVTGGSAGVFVTDVAAARLAETALRAEARDRYTVLTRAELDTLGAMPGAALGITGAPGWLVSGSCGRGITAAGRGGQHGYLPSRPEMATGFIAAGPGVRSGVVLERIRLVDVAPTVASLLGLTPPAVEGRVLREILE